MGIFTGSIQTLPNQTSCCWFKKIWDDLAASDTIPLPDWLVSETRRRRDEMIKDPKLGFSHDEILHRLRAWRNG